jgi:hypothetical protein
LSLGADQRERTSAQTAGDGDYPAHTALASAVSVAARTLAFSPTAPGRPGQPSSVYRGGPGNALSAAAWKHSDAPRAYLTWDEGAPNDWRGVSGHRGGGGIALIAAGGGARRHTRVAIPANHYALLRMIEANFGLRTLAQAGAQSTPLLRPLLRSRRAYARSNSETVSSGR